MAVKKKAIPTKRSPAATGARAVPTENSELRCESQQAWETWLEVHHATSRGVWLLLAKKGAPDPTVSYAQALEVALCFGWIDGQKAARGAQEWAQRFTPRGARSIWSKINVHKAGELIAAGKMRPPGLAAIDAAKGDGRWERAYASPRSAEVPDDLLAALEQNQAAKSFFATLSRANRYAILFRLQTAKKPETRARRLALCVGMLERGETFH